MKIFTAALGTETNTFSPINTTISDFEAFNLHRPGELPDQPFEFAAPLWVARQRATDDGWTVIEGTCAFALPAGVTQRQDYEALRDEILDQLASAMPVDAVAISMHGAMVAEGYPDCEGDMLSRIRALVGPDVAVGLEIDPHCHLSELMVDSADAIVIFKEYPHTDFVERAEELLSILERTVNGEVRPKSSVFDCRMLSFFHTTQDPMQAFVNKLKALEKEDPVLSISVAHGFPWGDVASGGTKMLVITDDDAQHGDDLARSLGMELFELRGKTFTQAEDMRETIRKARDSDVGPVVLADTADNPGGGAPGDSTFVLRELMEQQASGACIGPIWDPDSVQRAFEAGIGNKLRLTLGGKQGPMSGQPVEVHATVVGQCRDALQSFADSSVKLGDCVAVSFDGIDVVLSSLRCQALGVDLFTNVGIEPSSYSIVVVKSSQHFHDAFAPIAREVHYLDSPGALMQNLVAIPYQEQSRFVWPFVDDPFSADGKSKERRSSA